MNHISSNILDDSQISELQVFSITELSEEFDITTRTIRFYEDEGLLSPQRKGRNRIYSQRDRIRLKLVLRGKRLGFSLKEVAEIINMYDSEPGETGQLNYFLVKISEKLSYLQQQQQDIEFLKADLEAIEKQCHRQIKELSH